MRFVPLGLVVALSMVMLLAYLAIGIGYPLSSLTRFSSWLTWVLWTLFHGAGLWAMYEWGVMVYG